MMFILDRLNADFATTGLGAVGVVGESGADWGEGLTVFEFRGHQSSANTGHVEDAVALLASAFQDDVIDEHQTAWPQVGGRPLFPSANAGVACWELDGKPWCAVGQLAGALAVQSEADGASAG